MSFLVFKSFEYVLVANKNEIPAMPYPKIAIAINPFLRPSKSVYKMPNQKVATLPPIMPVNCEKEVTK